jgi:hypothetical protein
MPLARFCQLIDAIRRGKIVHDIAGLEGEESEKASSLAANMVRSKLAHIKNGLSGASVSLWRRSNLLGAIHATRDRSNFSGWVALAMASCLVMYPLRQSCCNE